MRRSLYPLSAFLLLGSLALAGCSGVTAFPDTGLPTSDIQPGAIQGSVYGGHAPIVGAHVYVLQAGQAGYASAALSELTTGSGTDSNGTYVQTDSSGAFNITGDYSCTPGHPVYLASIGGSSTANPDITITSATFTETGNSGMYTVKFVAANSLTFGENVTFSGLTGGYSQLNGTTQTTTAVSSTTFTIKFTGAHGSLSGSTTGIATFNVSPSIAHMAVLGLCPGSSGEFANTLSFVYINEVSTVAAANALAPFGSGPFNVGSTTTNLLGIQNAAVNAGQLYDIQGSNVDSMPDGEGHIARQYTPAPTGFSPNGIVPQATLDTLGNALASCVDSSGSTSSQCTALFDNATSNGKTTGTAASDTATAAFNIAHYPAGVGNANFVNRIYVLQSSGIVPFTPKLSSQPNDFSIAIAYPASLNTNMGNPESIAIDKAGNVVFNDQSTGYITKLTSTGLLSFNYNAGGTPGYVNVDPSNDIWFGRIGNSTPIDELNSTGTLMAHSSSTFSTVSATATDSSGNFYFVSASPIFNTYEFTGALGPAAVALPFSGSNTCIPSGDTYDHLAIDASQQLWVSDEHGGALCRFTTTGGAVNNFPYTFPTNSFPEAVGIDSNGAAWVSLENNNTLQQIAIHNGNGRLEDTDITSAGSGATFNQPFSATIDGLDNVWVTNRANAIAAAGSIAQITNAGVAVSPTTNYKPAIFNGASTATTYFLTDPLNAAIDGSGDVWITNYGGQEVVELIGAAAPVATPLSYASGSTTGLGARP